LNISFIVLKSKAIFMLPAQAISVLRLAASAFHFQLPSDKQIFLLQECP
jgi:hypothetical protein